MYAMMLHMGTLLLCRSPHQCSGDDTARAAVDRADLGLALPDRPQRASSLDRGDEGDDV
jgi:hypothetical protein